MGWQAVYLMANDLALGNQPSQQAAEALLALAPDRRTHDLARERYLRGLRDAPDDAVTRRALGYLERSIQLGDASGRWLSSSRNAGGRSGSMSAQS